MVAAIDKWAEARAAFIAGESARSISDRLGLSLTAVRKRAERGGWVSLRDVGQPVDTSKIRRVSRELSTLSQRLATLSESVSAAI